MPVARGTPEQRAAGTQPRGRVSLRSFDAGVVETLGAQIIKSNYFIPAALVPGVAPAPGHPGIPIVFSHPEDLYEKYRLPVVVVRRDDISPAMNRFHPGMRVWRAPAPGARPVEVSTGDPLNPTITRGFSAYEEQEQPLPFDITYTISITARQRSQGGTETVSPEAARAQVNKLLDYLLRVYPPHCEVVVKDDLGDTRGYWAFMESLSHLDDLATVSERVIGFALSLRVEAQLDLQEPIESPSVFGTRTIRQTQLTPDESEE